MIKSLNADYCGDTPHDKPVYLVADIPVRRQAQVLVSKRLLKKRERQIFNNLSLRRKTQFRKVGLDALKLLMR